MEYADYEAELRAEADAEAKYLLEEQKRKLTSHGEKIPKDYVKGYGKYCDNCYSQNIDFFRFFRICKDCRNSIDTSRVIWR